MLEGQLCYTIDLNKTHKGKTKPGEKYGLTFLVDTGPLSAAAMMKNRQDTNWNQSSTTFDIKVSDKDETDARIYVHLVSGYSNYGAGSYSMTSLKKMTGTTSFMEFPDGTKKCQKESFEACHAKRYFEKVEEECGCVPWALKSVHASKVTKHYFFL